MKKSHNISGSLTTLYSELLQQVMTAEASRNLGNLDGIFTCKKIKKHKYWYLQYREAGTQKQVYIGPDTPQIKSMIQTFHERKNLILPDRQNRQRLCAMLIQGGLQVQDPLMARVIRLLAEGGVFRLGSVLVGSHAFINYAALLGVAWPQVIRTQDIDLAKNKNVSLALSEHMNQVDLPDILEKAKMGFHPVPELNPKHPFTTFKIMGKEVHLDLLTPMIGPESSRPLFLKTLNAAAQPLRFLDYLIEETILAVVVYDDGLLVNVPLPARFAFHKIIVAQKRPVTEHAKVKKDLEQAALLFDVLISQRLGDILLAYDALQKRGRQWQVLIEKGLKQMETLDHDLVQTLKKVIK